MPQHPTATVNEVGAHRIAVGLTRALGPGTRTDCATPAAVADKARQFTLAERRTAHLMYVGRDEDPSDAMWALVVTLICPPPRPPAARRPARFPARRIQCAPRYLASAA